MACRQRATSHSCTIFAIIGAIANIITYAATSGGCGAATAAIVADIATVETVCTAAVPTVHNVTTASGAAAATYCATVQCRVRLGIRCVHPEVASAGRVPS